MGSAYPKGRRGPRQSSRLPNVKIDGRSSTDVQGRYITAISRNVLVVMW